MPSFLPYSLSGVASDFHDATNRNLLERWQPLCDWLDTRLRDGFDPSCKVAAVRTGARGLAHDRQGRLLSGVNLASLDPLNIATHPKVLSAVQDAAARFGVHSAGSAAMMGMTTLTVRLEERMAAFLSMQDALVLPSGGEALFAVFRALVQPGDHVILDSLAAPGIRSVAEIATRKVHRAHHMSAASVLSHLEQIRAQEPDAGILVITEALSWADSQSPELARLQEICRLHEATLLVDTALDLGSTGPGGRGVLAAQGLLGKVDIVSGTFARAFGSNGGFLACNHPALRTAIVQNSMVHWSSSAISPPQAAGILAALDLIEGCEGERRRRLLLQNCRSFRDGLAAQGYEVLGVPGSMIPVLLGGGAVARRMTAEVLYHGVIVNLTEHPQVPQGAARWMLQPMADHNDTDVETFLSLTGRARRFAA